MMGERAFYLNFVFICFCGGKSGRKSSGNLSDNIIAIPEGSAEFSASENFTWDV